MPALRVEIHEPANVLSAMLLTINRPRNTKLHPTASKALEYLKAFATHPSLGWLKEFYRAQDIRFLYGHVAHLSGPLTFVPESLTVPTYLASYEPGRMKDLPSKMTDFYRDTKFGTFRRQVNVDYTLAEADVRDAIEGARLEEFLTRMYGKIRYQFLVVPVSTHPFTSGATGALTGSEDYAFLHPPRITLNSTDPVSWSLDPERTQILAYRELSRGPFDEASRKHKDLGSRMTGALETIPRDAPFARSYPGADLQITELFLRASSASYLRHTRGGEAAYRWLDGQIRRTGTAILRTFFRAIEEFLVGKRWKDFDAFLADLPTALHA